MLPELDDYDWAEVFGEGSGGNCTPIHPDNCRGEASTATFGREDVETIYGMCEGQRDEQHWIIYGKLYDGRWFIARGWCDYTGWDCQADNDGSVAESKRELIIFVMDNDERTRFGLELPAEEDNE